MSQGSWQVPTGGSESAVTFAGQCNTAWLALASMNAGASAPANGPGSAPVEGQMWLNTTNASYPDVCLCDGASWPRAGTLDTVGHNWFPQLGGGQTTLASAANLDLGATRQTTIYISGSASIATLGTSAQIGERKRLQFTGQATLVNSAAIICPGGVRIVANAGDSCEVECSGANAWNVNWYTEANTPVGGGVQTGDIVFNPLQTGSRPGWVEANGGTIGIAGSNASNRASNDTYNLYALLWASSDPEFAITTNSGTTTTRGASASADFAAQKLIAVIDMRGRFAGGHDQMGAGAAASRITGATATPNGTTQGAFGGAQTVTLITANLPAYTPAGSISLVSGATASTSVSVTVNGSTAQGGGSGAAPTSTNGIAFASPSPSASASTTITANATYAFTGTAQGGSSSAVNKMPPFKLGTWYQKL